MITVIIKGTNGCNLACHYCSLGSKEDFVFADVSLLTDSFRYCCKYAKMNNDNELRIILHGGEPTMISPSVYEAALETIKTEYPEINYTILIQTNAYYISDEFVDFLKKYDVTVGVSIDGGKNIHDSERVTVNGLHTYENVCSNIDLLLNHNIAVSCLMVLTKNALNEDFSYLDFYAQRNLTLKINPLLNYGEALENSYLSLQSGEYSDYLIKLFEYVLKHNIPITISPIDKIVAAILNKKAIGECTFNPECNNNFICIDYSGKIYPCGRFSDIGEFCYGSIYDNITEISENRDKAYLLQQRNNNLPEQCKTCRYVSLCHGGCTAQRYFEGDINHVSGLCDDYQKLFRYFSSDGLKLIREKLITEKEELLKNEI